MNNTSVEIPTAPNYLEFVDADIAAMFQGNRSYLSHEPLLAQLIKELRLARAARQEGPEHD